MKFARVVNNTAVDVRDNSPEGCFTPNIVAEFSQVPDNVQDGWCLNDGAWSKPPVIPPHVLTADEILAMEVEAEAAEAAEAAEVRKERDAKLASTDWTQVADAPVDQVPWAVYRQSLRDVPAQVGFPSTIEWPTEPQ